MKQIQYKFAEFLRGLNLDRQADSRAVANPTVLVRGLVRC